MKIFFSTWQKNTTHITLAPVRRRLPDLALLLATMASNNQAIRVEWSKQRDKEDIDKWQWRLNNPPNDICEAFGRVADAADATAANAAAARRGEGWWMEHGRH